MSKRAVRIGITGQIGCGKSTIARWLAERPGVVAIDADRVARDVRREPDIARRVTERFGTADAASLAGVVFADEVALRDLEAIVHPAVRPRILQTIADADATAARAVVIEAIKLVEGGLSELCDEVWLVKCAPDKQRARLIARGSSPADADRRIAAQGDLVDRLAPVATHVVDSSGSPPEVQRIVSDALDASLARPR